jgi:hypothetical protein
MVLDARRRRGAVSKFELDNTVIQHGFELRGKALQLRIMWAILWNFKRLSPHLAPEEYVNEWTRYILPQLMQVKDQCSDLLVDAEKANMVKQQIEARIYRAQFISLELRHSPLGSNMPEEVLAGVLAAERDSLAQCDLLIAGNPSAAYLTEDVEKARKLLRGGTFYSFVSSEEKKEIYAAMSREFSGTGHWYYCEQGHPVRFFTSLPLRYLLTCDGNIVFGGRMRYANAAGELSRVWLCRWRARPQPNCRCEKGG